jgi:DNA-binding GntR family transcriptional regulator
MSSGASRRISRTSLAEEIRRRIREQVLSGELPPGARLTEQGIAESMGTSAGPVREAFAALTGEGLLISFRHRGTFVSSASREEIRNAYQIRFRLEPYAAALLLDRITPATIDHLSGFVEEMRTAAAEGDYPAMSAADMRFHGVFYTGSGSALLASIWPLLEGVVRKFMAVGPPQLDVDLDEIVAKHELLLQHLAARDRVGLAAALDDHGRVLWRTIGEIGGAGLGEGL